MSIWGEFIASNVKIFNLQDELLILPYIKIPANKRIGPHNIDILSIIFGSLLGDGYAEKKSNNTRITFQQEASHLEYGFWLHNYLVYLGYNNKKKPQITTRLGKKGKVRKLIRFRTWTYYSLNWIHDLFYINNIKKVPFNIIEYLTPLALAIWIMDNGIKSSSGLKFCKNSFTYEDCLILQNTLYIKYKLKCTIQFSGIKNQYVIYIKKESIKDLYNIVNLYIVPSMKYKFNI